MAKFDKMIKLNFELKPTPNRRGMYVVMLRITEKRKHKRIITPVEISRVSDWNQKRQEVKNTAEHAAELNDTLFKIKTEALKTYGELKEEEPVSAASLKRQLQFEAEKHLLLDFCNKKVKSLNDARQYGTAKKYQDSVNKLTAFLKSKGSDDLLITELDYAMVEQYRDYLNTLPNRKNSKGNLSKNSITKHLKILRAILNDALKSEFIKENPMTAMHLKEESTPQRHLSQSEFDKLKNAKFPVGGGLDKARDLFVASYYMAGMRFGDILSLRWNNLSFENEAGRLDYVMLKNHKEVKIKIHEDLVPILQKYRTKSTKEGNYVFPYLDNNAPYASYKTFKDIMTMPKETHKQLFNAINSRESLINKELKACADMIGIPAFSFHSARRAFVNRANEAGVRCTEIQSLLQHSSLSTTERYIKSIDTAAQDTAIDMTFSLETKEREARILVGKLINLGYMKADVKRLFDEASESSIVHRKSKIG